MLKEINLLYAFILILYLSTPNPVATMFKGVFLLKRFILLYRVIKNNILFNNLIIIHCY